MVADVWSKGYVHLGSISDKSANYLAGYVTKKMTSRDDARLQGRHPEFARQSRRPGIGADYMLSVGQVLTEYKLANCETDVPGFLYQGRRELYFGRYLHGKLREAVGRPKNAPQAVMDALDAEMLPLREAAKNSEDNPSLKARIIEKDQGRLNSVEARSEIFRSRRVI